MIYYNDVLLNWKTGSSQAELDVRKQIEDLEKKFFGPNAKGVAVVRWDQGARVKNETGLWEPKRLYPVCLLSADRMWRYSSTRAINKKGEDPIYVDQFEFLKDETAYFKDKIELIWYFTYHAADFPAKILRFEDPEKEAAKIVSQMSDDTEVKFYLLGKSSELSKNEDALRSIAEAFGVDDVHTLNIDELKVAIYEKVTEGQRRNDKACNYDVFMEFVQESVKSAYAAKARKAIADKDLYFDRSEYAWFLKGQQDPFLRLKGTEVDSAVSIVVDKVINSPSHAVALMKFFNEEATLTADAVRKLKRPDLLRIAKANNIVFSNQDKNEEIVQKIIDGLGLS